MTKFERTCWCVALDLLIQMAVDILLIGTNNNVIYDMSDQLRRARRIVKELQHNE